MRVSGSMGGIPVEYPEMSGIQADGSFTYPSTMSVPWVMAAPIGCICPPGANKECERVNCPRQGVK